MGIRLSHLELPSLLLPNITPENWHTLHNTLQLFVMPHEVVSNEYASLYQSTVNHYARRTTHAALEILALANGLQFIPSNITLYRAHPSDRADMEATPFYTIDPTLEKKVSDWYALAQQAISDGDLYVSCALVIHVDKSMYDTPLGYSTTNHANVLLVTLIGGNKIISSRHDGHGNVIPHFSKMLDDLADGVTTRLFSKWNPVMHFVPITDRPRVQGVVGDCVGWSVLLAVLTARNPGYATNPSKLYGAINKAGAYMISVLFYFYLFQQDILRYGIDKFTIIALARLRRGSGFEKEASYTGMRAVAGFFDVAHCSAGRRSTYTLPKLTWHCDPKYCIQCSKGAGADADVTCIPRIIGVVGVREAESKEPDTIPADVCTHVDIRTSIHRIAAAASLYSPTDRLFDTLGHFVARPNTRSHVLHVALDKLISVATTGIMGVYGAGQGVRKRLREFGAIPEPKRIRRNDTGTRLSVLQ